MNIRDLFKDHQLVITYFLGNNVIHYFYREIDPISVHCHSYSSNVGDRLHKFGGIVTYASMIFDFFQGYEGYEMRIKLIPKDTNVYNLPTNTEGKTLEEFLSEVSLL